MAFLWGGRVTGLQASALPGGILGLLWSSPMIPLTFTLPVAGPVSHEFDDIVEVENTMQECQEQNDNIQLIVEAVDENEAPIDISTASAMTIILRMPDGRTAEKTAARLTSGMDGKMQYTTKAIDLTDVGLYQLQGEYVISGKTQTTRWGKFRVSENIE